MAKQTKQAEEKIPYEDREENSRDIPFIAQRTEREIAMSNFLISRRKIEEAYKTLREHKQRVKEIGEQYPEIVKLFNSNLKKRKRQTEEEEEESDTGEEREKKRKRDAKKKASLEKFLKKKKQKKEEQKDKNKSSDVEMTEAEIAREGGRSSPYDLRRAVKFVPVGGGRSEIRKG
jgi:hypothetical protein